MAARKKNLRKPVERNLTRELSALLAKRVLPDLTERAIEPSVRAALLAQFEREKKDERTADKFEEWAARTLEQVAVGWILSCVFIRTLEDRGYLTHRRLGGEGAADSEQLFFDLFPSLTQRDYLFSVFRELSRLPGGEEVLGPKRNPAWRLAPSPDVVRELLFFFRESDAAGGLVWRFEGSSTRFLGDLYQDISENVRERFALRQTPDFVEEFILDQTLEPAIQEFGLDTVRLLDPTCGSGHFLLGGFRHLFDARQRKSPALSVKEHAEKALGQVYGVDLNPYASAIARFRLILAYLEAAQIDKLRNAPRVTVNVVTADSLLYAAKGQNIEFASRAEDAAAWGDSHWQLEDPEGALRVFSRDYHAVVGNPPYIACKDPVLREKYRRAYASAAGKYALSAPFTERFFQLAVEDGFVGMINASSFMKREFGKRLIEEVLSNVELTHVVDTVGAHIPQHTTPTVLLFGRNRVAISSTIVAVMGKRGDPETPTNPAHGLVWSSIRDHFAEAGFENDFISVADIPRETLNKHPWSLGGGGAVELKALLEKRAEKRLKDLVDDIGFASFTGLDDLFVQPLGSLHRNGVSQELIRPMIIGESIRDWSVAPELEALTPYALTTHLARPLAPNERWGRFMWPYRACAENVASFGGRTRKAEGQNWWEWYRWQPERYRAPFRITFAFVATHNHFILDHGGEVFNRSAPIIKLPESATEDDHLALLAYLNSSTACFWMKQVFYPKGSAAGDISKEKGKVEENRYEFAGTGLKPLPIPRLKAADAIALAGDLEALSTTRASFEPAVVVSGWMYASYSRSLMDAVSIGERGDRDTLHRMVAVQEDLDWLVYSSVGLVDSACAARFDNTVALAPDVRPFLSPSDLPPLNLNPSAGDLWLKRRRAILASTELALIEQPTYKRRWRGARGVFGSKVATYVERAQDACVSEIAAAAEQTLKRRIAPISRRGLSLILGEKPELVALMEYAAPAVGGDALVAGLQKDAVPFLGALVFTPGGLAKQEVWERTWGFQRREDAGEKLQIPTPPKFEPDDFQDFAYWSLRGKLNVPKERFISYPGAEKDDDSSPVYGWAGWDHLQRATALAGLYHERKTEDGWPAARLVPLLAGLLELVPWLKQWHNEPTDDLGGEGAGDWYERYVEAEARSLGKGVQDLRDWRPEKGRKK